MSIFFGYEKLEESTDDNINFKRWEMAKSLDMNFYELSGIPAPTTDSAAMNKRVFEDNYLNLYRKKASPDINFYLNVTKAVQSGGVSYHIGTKIKNVVDETYTKSMLFQSDATKSVFLGLNNEFDFIQPAYPLTMYFDIPEMTFGNVSAFIVCRQQAKNNTSNWNTILSTDNGSYDKFIAYKGNTTNKLLYGGGYPVKEYVCDIPNNINTNNIHLISIHWMFTDSHVLVNNIPSNEMLDFNGFFAHLVFCDFCLNILIVNFRQ